MSMWRTFVTGICDRCGVDHGDELLRKIGEQWLCRTCGNNS